MNRSGIGIMLCMAFVAWSLGVTDANAQRQMERLGRGVVAIHEGDGRVFISWRMLGTDPQDIAFNVYRQNDGGNAVQLNDQPLTGPTHYTDEEVDLTVAQSYFVKPVIDGAEGDPSGAFTLPANAPAQPYLVVPLNTPEGYTPNDASVDDLDGDGEYEIILHQTGRAHDNSHMGMTDPPIFQAYKLDGTMLWEINLGPNIREGAHYTQFMVYDLDGDGRAELVCKTADGTTDARGTVIGDPDANYVNEQGLILAGPEFLTVFDGLTGEALATVDYIPPRHPDTTTPDPDDLDRIWGDDYGNRQDRFLAAIAYLDGERPSVVMCRGYYTRTVLAAWNWRDGELTSVWTFDSADGSEENRRFASQGNHQLSVADVDGDGRDEIIYGAMAIDDDGTGLYSTGLGHGDALHVTDMDPDRPGLEVFGPHESPSQYGPNAVSFRDAATGEVIWGVAGEGDIGRGVAMDIDPRHPGYEMWASSGIGGVYTAQQSQPSDEDGVPPRGVEITPNRPRAINFAVWWDGDLLREILDQNHITKWDWENETEVELLVAEDCSSNNGTKATPTLSADILGDWREEVIWRTDDGSALRIYTTTIPTEYRFYTLMHDPQYRLAIAWQNVAYNQPPHPSFFLGHDTPGQPKANITTPGSD